MHALAFILLVWFSGYWLHGGYGLAHAPASSNIVHAIDLLLHYRQFLLDCSSCQAGSVSSIISACSFTNISSWLIRVHLWFFIVYISVFNLTDPAASYVSGSRSRIDQLKMHADCFFKLLAHAIGYSSSRSLRVQGMISGCCLGWLHIIKSSWTTFAGSSTRLAVHACSIILHAGSVYSRCCPLLLVAAHCHHLLYVSISDFSFCQRLVLHGSCMLAYVVNLVN